MAENIDPTAEQPGDRFAVTAIVTTEQAAELLARDDFDFGCRPLLHPKPDGTASLDLLVTRKAIDDLQARGHRIEVGENVSAAGRVRQREVGEGDRFEGGRVAPRGVGRKDRGPKA